MALLYRTGYVVNGLLIWSVVSVWVLRPSVVEAQTPQYIKRTWTPEDGLPSNVINKIYQSDKGYIWIATYSGLARFDGKNFRTFRPPAISNLANTVYTAFYEDSGGTLWIGSISSYLIAHKKGTNAYEITDLSDQGPENTIYSILEDNHGNILFSTKYGVYQKSGRGVRQLTRGFNFSNLRKFDNKSIYLLIQDKIGIWEHGNYEGEPKIFAEKLGDHRFRIDGKTIGISEAPGSVQFRDLQELPDGKWLLYTSEGFLIFSEKSSHWISLHELGIDSGNGIFLKGNRLWLASRSGTYRMSIKGDEIVNVNRLTQSNDNAVYQDQEGSLWIGTANEGLRQLVKSPFTVYSETDGFASNAFLAVLQDSRGWRWIGTNCEGLHRITAQKNTLYDRTDGMTAECVWSLAETSDGRIWASDRKVVVYDSQQDQFKPAPFSNNLKQGRYRALFEDSEKQLWLGSLGEGLARWNGKNLTYYTTDDGLPSNKVRMIYEDKHQTLWLATEKGIAKITNLSDPAPEKLKAAGDFYYRSVIRDQRGLFWFGSYGNGITIYHPKTGDTTRVTTHTGLEENVASQIVEDSNGNIWLGGNKGLYVLPAQSIEQFLQGELSEVHTIGYGTDDGLRTAETSGGFQPAWQITDKGTILIPTVNGLVEINPAQLQKNGIPPPVYLEEVLVNGKPISEEKPLTFAYDDRRIQFNYSVLSFRNPDQIQVEYRMKPYDKGWQQATGNRQAGYTSLPPGSYVFQLRAANAYGTWNKTGLSVPVSVEAPFWQQWWFTLLFMVFVGGFVAGGVRLRTQYLRNRSRQLEQKVKERTSELKKEKERVEEKNQIIAGQNQELEELNRMKNRFITGISHEFRTPLTFIFGSLELAREKLMNSDAEDIEDELHQIGRHSEKLKELVDQFLELSRLEAGMSAMHESTISLNQLSAGLTSAFTSLAEQKHISYQVQIPPDAIWMEADRLKLEIAINNILKNAFKYIGEGGRVSYKMEADRAREQAIITVSDTGRGIAQKDQTKIFDRFYQGQDTISEMKGGTGIGLAITKEIIKMHEGDITLESKPGEGSTFTLLLPIVDVQEAVDKKQEINAEKPREEDRTDVRFNAHSPTKNTRQAKKILVVEDNSELRAFIKQRLHDSYEVLEAANGTTGLRMAKKHLPDLIISDVMMPNMDGYTFCKQLRNDPEIKFLPVILLTARVGEQDEIQGLEAGADDYIPKPFDTNVLRARVDNLIKMRMKLRDEYMHGQRVVPAQPRSNSNIQDDTDPFREKVDAILKNNIADPDFSVQALADELDMSRRQLLRKSKQAFDKTPNQYIRQYRLEVAAGLLKEQSRNISEIAYAVGFNNLSAFSRNFKKKYGQSPSAYQKSVS